MTAIESVMKFQIDRLLHERPYNPENEHVNILEEMLESIGYDVPKENRENLMKAYNTFVEELTDNRIALEVDHETFGYEQKADAYADMIVFACGALMKLGYDPEKVLVEVGKEINSRTGSIVNGKFEKDLSPEAKANWHKASFRNCTLVIPKTTVVQRNAYMMTVGSYGTDEEILEWLETLK